MRVYYIRRGEDSPSSVELDDGSTVADFKDEIGLSQDYAVMLNNRDVSNDRVLPENCMLTFSKKQAAGR